MYNLIVSGDENAFDGRSIVIDLSRCIREYTDKNISETYKQLNDQDIKYLMRLPTLFCYETDIGKDSLLGIITSITTRKLQVKIEYKILDSFLSNEDIMKLSFELDITDWEMNRTHWALKDIDLVKELRSKGIDIPDWIKNNMKKVDITKHIFDVSLSFPGTARNYVENIVKELEKLIGPDSYFYDNNYKAQLARPSLDLLLQDIYKNRSKLIVVFVGIDYQNREWCGLEFKAIRDLLMQKENEKIMYIKIDDGDVEGVFKTDGYIDSRNHTPIEIASFIIERLNLIK